MDRVAATPGPVPARERIEAIDTLRGFALLGILVMNVTGIAFPMAAYFNPLVYGGPRGVDFGAWVVAHLFFDMKMMGVFSMLFGAGLVLMWERAATAGRRFAGIWYRRTFWLLVIGFAHAYLLWHGDILVTYALCGFVLYLFRRRSAGALLAWGIGVLVIGALLCAGGGYAVGELRAVALEIEGKVAAGEEMTAHHQELVDRWEEVRRESAPTREELQETIDTMRGSSLEVLRENAEEARAMHLQAIPFLLFWRALALMLIGMGLMKLRVFTGERSTTWYRRCVLIGFGSGLPVVAFGIHQRSLQGYDFMASMLATGQYNYFASVLVSLGWIGLVMGLCSAGALPRVCARLAAVGRMALTNYLAQTLIGVLIFHGHGLALFGEFGRAQLWLFIAGIWAAQLAYSPWWLRRYRYGPAEWLWRSLTYGEAQPMRRSR